MDRYILDTENMTYNFFTVTTTLIGSVIIASCFIARHIWWPMVKKSYEEDEEAEQYEYLYLDKFGKPDDCEYPDVEEEHLEKLYKLVVSEETPRGQVVMLYNKKTESWWYYADSKEIPYSYLDTVARQYCLKYDCKGLYINTLEEFRKGKVKIAEKIKSQIERKEKLEEENEEEKSEEEYDVFAKFKSYNRENGGDSFNEDTNTNKKYYVLKQSANRYTYKGRIENCEYYEEESERESEAEKEDKSSSSEGEENSDSDSDSEERDLDYTTFKNMEQKKE